MKKHLLVALLFLLGAVSLRADLIWYEGYNYPNGRIDVVSTNGIGTNCNWLRHSGTGGDALVSNHQEQISASPPGTLPRTDDVHRFFIGTYTNALAKVYASFTIVVTNLPGTNTGGYFAHFLNGSSTFYGKVFCVAGSLPGTYRLGAAGAASAAPSKIFPADLCTNLPYQVVISYDAASSQTAQLWVNPLGSGDTSVTSIDTVSGTQQILQSFAFRQGGSSGNFFCSITNAAAATTFDEAATNVWATNAIAPILGADLANYTGFVGVSNALYVLADGQSEANLNYQWFQNGTNITTLDGNTIGNTNFLSFSNPTTNDSGSYKVVVTTPFGLSVTSHVSTVSITFAPVPPTFTVQPASNTTVYPGQTVNLTVNTTGPGPITYQWNYAGGPVSGGTDPTLQILDVTTTNGTAGIYECDAINQYGTNHSSNATVTVIFPTVAAIHTLRGLVDPVFFLPTNTTLYYTTTGTVISKTNFTTSANDECFISDGTGSISVFFGGGATFRPNLGDVITVAGPLAQFSSLLEFSLSATDPSTTATIISSNNPAPLSTVLPLTFTNSVAFGGTSNALRNFGGSLATFNNVTITPGGGTTNFASSGNYTLTDTNGNTLTLFVYSGFTGLIGTPIPAFCYNVTGVLSEFLSATAPDRSSGYQLEISSPSDFVTNPPSAMTLSMTTRGALNWTAVPYSYNYSVYAASNVTGPYLPLATGLIFPTVAGSYTDTNITAGARFYRVTAP